MNLVVALQGIVFVGLISIMRTDFCCGRSRCLAANPLNQTDDNCKELLKNSKSRFRIQCSPNATDSRYPDCLSWCKMFARCFKEARPRTKWIKQCARKFRATSQRFKIISIKSNVTVIHVLRCRPLWKGFFIITIRECSCEDGDNDLDSAQPVTQESRDPSEDTPQSEVDLLRILAFVGLALSLPGAVVTIICYLLFTDKESPLCQIRVSLVVSLLAGQIIFLAGIDATEKKDACVTVAAVMQYFAMAALCWMLMEGIFLYLLVVKVYYNNHKMSVYHGFSWGFPAVLVAISLSIAAGTDGVESFVGDRHCWLSTGNTAIWILFASIVSIIELVNVLILGRVIKEILSMRHAKDKQMEQIRLGIKACAVMIPLFGITWLFGLLTPAHKVFLYIFVILNSSQGFFVFFLHCVRNSEIRARFKRRIGQAVPLAHSVSQTNDIVRKSSQAAQHALHESHPQDIIELQ